MNHQNTCAIAYQLRMNPSAFEGLFTVSFTWAFESGEGISMVVPRTWLCKLPNPIEYVDQPFGTSETKGIVGGVEQPWLHAQSEVVERTLGDACTVAFAEINDLGVDPSNIMLLGPAFPKVIGRFLSLRPSPNITICWVTPVNVPSVMEHLWRLLLPLQAGTGPALPWSNNALLDHFGYPNSNNPKYWIQFLSHDHNEQTANVICKILDYPTIKKQYLNTPANSAESLPEVELPRQLRLAVDITAFEQQALQSYQEYRGIKLLKPEESYLPRYLLPSVNRDKPVYQFNSQYLN